MDIFLEYIVKKKQTPKSMALNIGIIVLACILTYVLLVISASYLRLGTIGFVVIAAIWFFVYILLTMSSKEFEYSITNGELDIDVIISRRKRKHLLSAKLRTIELCANVHDPAYQHAKNQKDASRLVIMAASEKNATRTYFADLTGHDGKNYRLYWEPSPKMLEAILKFNPANMHIYTCAEEA